MISISLVNYVGICFVITSFFNFSPVTTLGYSAYIIQITATNNLP